jgi:glycosyltransferase involved in cell wall biosynthesis
VTAPLYLDVTTMYRWRDLAPVGVVRLERLLAGHLRYRASLGPVQYLLWDGGYRPTDANETARIDLLLDMTQPPVVARRPRRAAEPDPIAGRKGIKPTMRRAGLRVVGRMPEHLRPFAEQAAWSTATLAVESARHLRRARERRRTQPAPKPANAGVRHAIDFAVGGDLVALGLGWEYLDHEAMYELARSHGLRIHMPAFDLIPISMPQMNSGQSHLVHRHYAEMAHYADTITSISEATADALRAFYVAESLPIPHLATNPLPGFERSTRAEDEDPAWRRHRFEGEQFVLTVSTVEIRKNHLLLAKIWAECIREGYDLPRLVIVGRIGWDVVELMRWINFAPELRDKVVIAADVEDDELVALYEDALFTVFPSRIEGWGLPITEALSHRKVCVHATDPAQYEASQGLMPAFHPDDFPSWKQEILRLMTDDDYRNGLERSIAASYVPRTPDEYCVRFEEILASRRAETR